METKSDPFGLNIAFAREMSGQGPEVDLRSGTTRREL
jgi:hypothetical protein